MIDNLILINPRKLLRVVVTIFIPLFATQCAVDYPEFLIGNTDPGQFRSDGIKCRAKAQLADLKVDQQAERYEGRASAEAVGAGIGAMLLGPRARSHAYQSCMEALGYKR